MNMLVPDTFSRVSGAKVKVVINDICPLREDYGVAPILMSVLRELARDSEIIIEHCDDMLNEASLTDTKIAAAVEKSDADILVFGSYVATRSNVQPMIHIICTYGRPMNHSAALPEGLTLEQAINEGDAILQVPQHTLIRDVLPVMAVETLSFQNTLAYEIFAIAQFIQALKLYKADKYEEVTQVVDAILTSLGSPDQWPSYWVPFSYLHMLGGLAYLRMGDAQAAAYTLSSAIARSTPDKARIQRTAEQIIAGLLQAHQPEQASEQEAGAAEAEAATLQ